MHPTLTPSWRKKQAGPLILTLVFVAVSMTIYVGLLSWSSSNSKVTARNNQYFMSEAAAEAATETMLATMNRDFLYQTVANGDYYAALRPQADNWPVKYTFSDITVTVGKQSTSQVPLGGQFLGLSGFTRDCSISATATPLNQLYAVPASISQNFSMASIPVFQYAIFYNLDLEINPGNSMYIKGKVFCNKNIYATGVGSSSPLTFADTVQAVGTYSNNRGPKDPSTRSGGVAFLMNVNNPTTGVGAVSLPICGSTNNNPAVVRTILGLPPAGWGAPLDAAYSTNGQIYFCNSCDLIVSNSASGLSGANGDNLSVYFNDGSRIYANRLLPIPNNLFVISHYVSKSQTTVISTNDISHLPAKDVVLYTGYSFLTNVTFYDFRESAKVQAVQIDIAALGIWRTNKAVNGGNTYNNSSITSKGHPLDSIYIFNNVPFTHVQLPAVRVVNGAKLPTSYGLTVATPFPLYVKGNYNVMDDTGTSIGTADLSHTWPASLMADAITVLSTNWQDSYSSGSGYTSRGAVATTVNAAAVEGIVESSTDSHGNDHYSGGVENFIRLLEDWGNDVNTYNGSIVVLFASQYATNIWASRLLQNRVVFA